MTWTAQLRRRHEKHWHAIPARDQEHARRMVLLAMAEDSSWYKGRVMEDDVAALSVHMSKEPG